VLDCSRFHPFQKFFELVEPVAPEGAVVMKPIDDRRQRIGLRPIVGFASFAAMPHQFCFFQDCEVLGDSRLGYACIASQGVHSLFSTAG
jgi:hypothetical protein